MIGSQENDIALEQQASIIESRKRAIINDFRNTLIKIGPTTKCKCCGCLWFSNQTSYITKERISFNDDVLMTFLFEDENDQIICCKTCLYSLKQKKRPTIVLINVLEFPQLPPEITELNRIEERLVAI